MDIGEPIRSLKFRKVMVSYHPPHYEEIHGSNPYGWNWACLDRFWGNKIKTRPDLIKTLDLFEIRKGVTVERVYSTICEFANAYKLHSFHELEKYQNHLLSSWMVIESDIPHHFSWRFYQELYGALQRQNIEPTIISTGGRSLHFWVEFPYEQYLSPRQRRILDTSTRYSIKKRVWLEKKARFNFLHYHLFERESLLNFVDTRVGLDVMRIVPVTGTWNNQTKKWITPIPYQMLWDHPSEIIRLTTMAPDSLVNEDLKFDGFMTAQELAGQM